MTEFTEHAIGTMPLKIALECFDRELQLLKDGHYLKPEPHYDGIVTQQALDIAGDRTDPHSVEIAAHLLAQLRGTCGCCNSGRALLIEATATCDCARGSS